MDKKAWIKPALVVLTRQDPQEAVLAGCKYTQQSGSPVTQTAFCVHFASVIGCNPCVETVNS